MPEWPRTIPYDLFKYLESVDHDDWFPAFQIWATSHGLPIELQWEADLLRRVGRLDEWRWAPKVQDRWGAIREWLVVHEVTVPDGLPVRPEQGSHR